MFFKDEVRLSLDKSAHSREEWDAGWEDMHRAFEAIGISRKEVDDRE